MDTLYYVFGTLIFIAVVLLIESLYLVWNSSQGPQASRLSRRLRLLSGDRKNTGRQASIVKERVLSTSPWLHNLLLKLPRVEVLDRLLQQSGKSWRVADIVGMALLAFFLAALAGAGTGLPSLLWLALSVAAALLPLLVARSARAGRITRIEAQLPDALDLIGRAMRAGHAFPTALKMVGDEMTDPLGGEFQTVFDEVNFGVSMQDALTGLAARVPSTDLRYFVIAVMIQRETGGNLTELLSNISAIIRDRMKLLGQIRVMSAEGKLSAWILGLLPFGAALLMHLTNPTFLEILYTDPGGRKMLMGAGIMMAIGVLAMRKVIRIRV